MNSDYGQWFFFYRRKSSSHGIRNTIYGYWKSIGKDLQIKSMKNASLIGTIKTFLFHKGLFPEGIITNWVMHEYRSVHIRKVARTTILLHI